MGSFERVWTYIAGESRSRSMLVVVVLGVGLLFSGGFVLGFAVGLLDLFPVWAVLLFGIALGAGFVRAGLLPTIGSLWLLLFWLITFPPLVGYLTGDWEMASRYTYPRFLTYGYSSAAAELRGGVERGVEVGFIVALVIGLVGYVPGAAIAWLSKRLKDI